MAFLRSSPFSDQLDQAQPFVTCAYLHVQCETRSGVVAVDMMISILIIEADTSVPASLTIGDKNQFGQGFTGRDKSQSGQDFTGAHFSSLCY